MVDAIADILFQGFDDLSFPSLYASLSHESSNRSTFRDYIYGETRQLSVPEYGESMSTDPRGKKKKKKKKKEREEAIFLE